MKREIGKCNRIGLKTILLHITISGVGMAMLDLIHNDFRLIIMLFITLTLFFLWNNAIRSVIDNGLLYAFAVSLYFTVPSVMTGIFYYNSYMHPFQLDWVLREIAWVVVNYPFTIGNLQFGSLDSYTIWIQILMPIVAVNLLVLLNYIHWKRNAIKAFISPFFSKQ